MARVTVSTIIPVSPDVLWEELRHIDRHVSWMNDAVEITFLSEHREGTGTTFVCRTKIGPLSTNDVMTITEWQPGVAMGVTHQGIVTGSGVFTLEPSSGATLMTWTEELRFPWWGLGPLGAWCATPIFRLIWKKNLHNLVDVVRPSS